MRIEHWLYTAPLRLRSLFRRAKVEQDLDEELQYHLEHKIEEYVAQGISPAQARDAALRAMDGLSQRKEECRDARGVNAFDDTIRDVRYSARVLRQSPGFTAVAVLTLALAIAANAVVFSVLNALILRPLTIPQPETFYTIEHGPEKDLALSYPDYLDLRDHNRTFDGLATYNNTVVALDTGGNPVRSSVDEVSGNYFDVFRIKPYLGRFFHASNERGPNSAPYMVLTYDLWRSRFSSDRGVIGRTVLLNEHPFTIIGVAPRGFRGPVLFFSSDSYVPIVNQEQIDGHNTLNSRRAPALLMTIGHLKNGVTPRQAIADLNSIGSYLEKTYPSTDRKMSFALASPTLFGDAAGPGIRAFLTALMLLAGLILIAACANLGSLFAARASDRVRELALRLALGATRGRILRALFTEALLISVLGGAIGLWGGAMLLGALSAWQPVPQYPIHMSVSPDAKVYGVALLLTLISGFLFGAVPVKQVLRTDPYEAIKSGARTTGGPRLTLRDLLLVAQIAVCAVLVTSSLVAVRGLQRTLHSNFGFDPDHAMLIDTDLTMAGYRGSAIPAMQKRMIESMASIPGVTAVGLADFTPLSVNSNERPVFTSETADLNPARASFVAVTCAVSPGYFRAARTNLLFGRSFTWHDDETATRVAVVNEEFARKLFGSAAGALGRYFKGQDATRVQVVGIAENGYYENIPEDPRPAMFVPILQAPSAETSLVVRSNVDAARLAASMRSRLRSLDPAIPPYIQTWRKALDPDLFAAHMATLSLGVMGLIGAVLAITGVFGLAAYSVSKRLRELGIRMALGARRQEVLQAALGRALKLLALGSTAGLLLGILAGQVLGAIVYTATPRDPLIMAGVVVAMALIGLLATWIPAQRALSLDPITLLREE